MLVYHKDRRTVDVNGQEIDLTEKEDIVMALLYKANGAIVSVDDIGIKVYFSDNPNGWFDSALYASAIEKLISRVRKLIGKEYIMTARGAGWKFRQQEPKTVTLEVTPREAEVLRHFRSLSSQAQAVSTSNKASTAIRQLPVHLSFDLDEVRVQ